jgi:16S rRNA (adenine1518-N6/adenine1519-N6)-dimethyltransferase
VPTLTDLSTIRDLCARYDFALSKGFGQNFIINPGICPRIAEAAGIGPGWGALEVGPGIGVLTEQLCKRADNVVSIEVDKRLPPLLEETMADYDNFKLILNDVLKVDLKALLAEEFGGKPVAVCANLPYYITSPILMRLLEEKLPIRNITVMVQKEAAQRLCAAPGTRDAGAISYAVAYYAEPKLLFSVQPGHQGQVGHAGRRRAAPARDHRHRHQGRPVRHHDHRHVRGADLGQEGLAAGTEDRRRL